MDAVTDAIVTAVSLLKNNIASESTKIAVAEKYDTLKAQIGNKYGVGSQLAQAVEVFEEGAESEGRRIHMELEIAAVGASVDPDLLAAAHDLLVTAPLSEARIAKGVGAVHVGANVTGGVILHGEPGRAPSRLPAPPDSEDD